LLLISAHLTALYLAGCANPSAPQRTLKPASMPHEADARRHSLRLLGHDLFEALRLGSVRQQLATSAELEELVGPESRMRIERERRSQLTPVFRSHLVVARDGQGRSASWVEGRFAYTDQGWKTLSLTRIELPRRQHSDLDLAPCDVEESIR
jgi:hypothetical protein